MHFASDSDARAHFKEILDVANRDRVATVRRDAQAAEFVDVEEARSVLTPVNPSRAQVVAEAGGWSVFIPGLPVSADGGTFDEAVDETIVALREYAEDWQERLLVAANHRNNWPLVKLIECSDDGQLRDWLVHRPNEVAALDPPRP